jgi:hypothetical protein
MGLNNVSLLPSRIFSFGHAHLSARNGSGRVPGDPDKLEPAPVWPGPIFHIRLAVVALK